MNLILIRTDAAASPAGAHPPAGFVAHFLHAAVLVCALLLLIPVSAAGEEPADSLKEVRSRLRSAGYSPGEWDELLPVLESAREQDIPLSLLTTRVYEGAAKKVPLGRIAEVIETETQLLARAREMLLNIPGTSDFLSKHHLWQRTAHLIEKGLTGEEISKLIRVSLSNPELYRPASTLFISLTSWGLSADAGHRVIQALAESSIPPQQYTGVTQLYKHARAQRISPEQLTARIIEAAPTAHSMKELEERTIMQ